MGPGKSCCQTTYNPILLPTQDNKALKEEHRGDEDGPFEFATAIKHKIDFRDDDRWQSNDEGQLVWKESFYSPGAFSLNFGFSTYSLPEGAYMLIYNDDQSDVKGPFTSQDNESHGQMWTPIIQGDLITIEIIVPIDSWDEFKLSLLTVNHDFIGLSPVRSGSCHLDVICGSQEGFDLVDKYRKMINGVGAYHFNGTAICSGSLINNSLNDCTPFFLTAEHCNVNQVTAPTVVVYWNYQNSYCRLPYSEESGGNGNGILNQYNTGAIFRASSEQSDFTLIELDDPLDPAFRLYLPGWNRSLVLPQETALIHHPKIEEKRISINQDPVSYKNDNIEGDFIQVDNWEIGSSEVGSSGGPLFNAQGQIIGQLNGGQAACGNNDYDEFGWIRSSWDGQNAAHNALKYWLDPDGLEGESMDGLSCGYSIDLVTNRQNTCSDETNQMVIESGVSSFFSDNVVITLDNPDNLGVSVSNNNIGPGQAFTITIHNLDELPPAIYRLTIMAKSGEEMARETVFLEVSNQLPAKPELEYPVSQQEDVSLTPYLQWSMDEQALEYQIQIASDDLFDQLLYDFSVKANGVLQAFELEGSSQYFWRVKALNHCGESDWSNPQSFTTKNRFCTTITWDEGLVIPNSASTVVAKINNPYNVYLESVYVPNIHGTHSYVGDLGFSLEHQGLEVSLWEYECGDDQDFNLGFSDISSAAIACPPTNGAIVESLEPLSQFTAMNAGGDWRLIVDDAFNSDGGYLEHWEIEFCFADSEQNTFLSSKDQYDFCENNDLTFDCYLKMPDLDLVSINVLDQDGNLVDASVDLSLLESNKIVSIGIDSLPWSLGTYVPLTLQAYNNTSLIEHEIVIVREEASEGVQILSPYNEKEYHFNESVIIQWNSSEDDRDYVVEISTDSMFNDIVYTIQTQEKLLVADYAFADSSHYFLRIHNHHVSQCPGLSSVHSFKYGFTSSNNEIKVDQGMLIFPNPADQKISILTHSYQDQQLVIYNFLGQIIHICEFSEPSLELETNAWEAGIYYAVVIDAFNQKKIQQFQILH